MITPFGRIGTIDDLEMLDVRVLKRKSVSLYGEGMFNRSVFNAADMMRQHEILDQVAGLVDTRQLRSIAGEHFGALSASHLIAAYRHVAHGHARGKAVLNGFK